MTCPSCGTIAASDAERCARCGTLLAAPADAPTWAVPVVRAPTHRGEISQREAGIVAVSLVPPAPSPSPAFGGPAPVTGPSRPSEPAPAHTPPAPPVVRPAALRGPVGVAPPDATPGWSPARPATGRWSTQPAPPPVGHVGRPAPTSSPEPEQTGVLATADEPTRVGDVRHDDAEDERRRAARAGLDAAWPPPPGRWTGQQPSES